MTSALIGYTGFVGSNLKEQYAFDDLYNSQNILKIKNKEYDLVICSGIPSSMWMANNEPEKDLQNIKNLLNILLSVKSGNIVLISSIAIYKQPVKCFTEESNKFEIDKAYGHNRRYAEQVVSENFDNYNIIRLPALFGNNLKKNFIFDLINQEPTYFPKDKFALILAKLNANDRALLQKYYYFNKIKGVFDFNKIKAETNKERKNIKGILRKVDFTSLMFTNAESLFQFYNLNNLKKDITIAIDNKIKFLNICSEPIKAKDIAKAFFKIDLANNNTPLLYYNMKSIYAKKWGKKGSYQYSKKEIFCDLESFFKKNL